MGGVPAGGESDHCAGPFRSKRALVIYSAVREHMVKYQYAM
jgi:hypothetical protein